MPKKSNTWTGATARGRDREWESQSHRDTFREGVWCSAGERLEWISRQAVVCGHGMMDQGTAGSGYCTGDAGLHGA